ncbi:MAG: hypothetical protein ACHQ0J_02235 [Candidatus Dormibacterales bacterium]
MTAPAWLGVVLLGVGVVAIAIEGTLAAVWTRRISRRAAELNRRTQSEVALIQADVERLRMALEESRVLWQPYRRLLRWLMHPLTVALVQSFVRRRTASR